MTDVVDPPDGDERLQADALPTDVPAGTILVAGTVDPAEYAPGLRILCRYGRMDETALVVTARESVGRITERYDTVCPGADRPSPGFVDTTSEQQYVSAPYGETPVVFVPSSGDLERLVLALSELACRRPPTGRHHLLVRSLSPLLRVAPVDRVQTVLERVSRLSSEDGLCLFGFDYTAHDEETTTELAEMVDGVLWVSRGTESGLEFELRANERRLPRLAVDGSDER